MSHPLAYPVAADAAASERVAFIKRTYGHLAGAIGAFVALEAVLLQLPIGEQVTRLMMGSMFSWFIVLAAFMAVSWVAQSWAHSRTSRTTQYMGLGLYVVAEAIIFLPLLFVATSDQFPQFHGAVPKAGIITATTFGGLTLGVLMTGHDFSFLRTAIWAGSFALLGLIVVSMLGFGGGFLSTIIPFVGVALACGFILYGTSNVLHHYPTDHHVGAALELFASVALLFWYVLQIVMSQSSD